MDKTKMKKVETFASIFGEDHSEVPSEKTDGTTSLKLDDLIPFRNHPFKLYEGDRFNDMVESIKQYGVIVPIVVRKVEDKYEILSGHNRVNAAKEAGLTEVPTVIKEGLTEEEATLIVTETNIMQRSFSELAHSERATVISTRHSAMKNQGVRTDLLNEIEKLSKAPNLASEETFYPMDKKLRTHETIGNEYNLSQASVMLTVADENGGKLPNRVMIYADEIGTIPKIESFEMMLSAGRSRRISVIPIIQSFAQLDRNYGKEGSQIIIDNCQLTIFGGFAPNSETAQVLSKALGSRTVMSGSISRGKNDLSQSLQMIERPLLTADELKALPKGNFVVMKTGVHPMKTKLKLFLDWGITFEKIYETEEKSHRKVYYADKEELEENIVRHTMALDVDDEATDDETAETGKRGGTLHSPAMDSSDESAVKRKAIIRT